MREIQNVVPKQPIVIGSKVKMEYRKKYYFGTVIDVFPKGFTEEGSHTKTTRQVTESNQQSSKPVTATSASDNETSAFADFLPADYIKSKKPMQLTESNQLSSEPATATSASDKESSTVSDFSPPDDTDSDPDYEQCCEVVGCREDVFSACDKCLALMCYHHFIKCQDLDCHRAHSKKKIPKELTITQKSHDESNKHIQNVNSPREPFVEFTIEGKLKKNNKISLF